MVVLAHRGFHVVEPENTLAAFDAAVNLGVDGIETDVRQTRDGELVLIHDRVIKGGGLVSQLTKSELEQQLNHPVPTLVEALNSWSGILWNVEIKTLDALANSIKTLRQFEHTRRIFVSSFRHDVVIECATHLDVDCGLLMASRPVTSSGLIAEYLNHKKIRSVVWDFNILDRNQVTELRQKGWRNFVYGPVTLEEHSFCIDVGLDGIVTDHPNYLLERK